jgi:hypothetical protein
LTTRFDFHYLYGDWSEQYLNIERSGNRHG